MCWMSPKTPPAAQGCTLTGKIALPPSRAWHQLRKTPFGGQPTGRQQGNHRLALAQLPIERLLPGCAALDPRLRIEIEEQRSMAFGFQPSLHFRRRRAVRAAVADEYRGHLDRQPLNMVLMRLGQAVLVVSCWPPPLA